MWLAERVWEPHMPKILSENRIEYTLVDDSNFLMTGMTEDQMDGAYLSEEQCVALKVLPIRKDLRYAIPFHDPGETLTLLRNYVTPSGYRAMAMFYFSDTFGP